MDPTVEAVGRLTEALEWIERARGRLYDFHHMIGRADFLLDEAVERLEAAGHGDAARQVAEDLVGRNVLEGRWTFQVVEEFERQYYEPVRGADEEVRASLMDGRRHVLEAELKERRRTPRRAGHESRPPTTGDG